MEKRIVYSTHQNHSTTLKFSTLSASFTISHSVLPQILWHYVIIVIFAYTFVKCEQTLKEERPYLKQLHRYRVVLISARLGLTTK